MMQVEEKNLITRKIEMCENCEWCIPSLNYEFPHCLLTGEETGLFQKCNYFKWRTGNHISM